MPYYGYCLYGTTFSSGTGTVTTGIGLPGVTGVSTVFTTQLTVGSIIKVSGIDMAVDSITDDTHLLLQSNAPASLGGMAFTYVNPTNIELISTGIFPPRPTFKPWVEALDLGNGLRRGMGRPIGSWRWGYLTLRQRDALRTYCPQSSSRIFLRTRQTENSDAYQTYEVAFLWPDEPENWVAHRLDKPSREEFTLSFRDMVLL